MQIEMKRRTSIAVFPVTYGDTRARARTWASLLAPFEPPVRVRERKFAAEGERVPSAFDTFETSRRSYL